MPRTFINGIDMGDITASMVAWMASINARVSALEANLPETPEASEPKSERLFIMEYNKRWLCYDNVPATPAQVRAEAVRLGLLDTPRQKVAEEFLHEAQSAPDGTYSYQRLADWLKGTSRLLCWDRGDSVLNRMASVLEYYAKEAAE